jgi:hypothetical protein
MADFSAVFDRAVRETAEAKDARVALEACPEAFVRAVEAVRADLLEDILATASKAILDAAAKGMSTATLYAFNGNDAIDDVSVLFVFKGHRKHAAPPPPGTPRPLLLELQQAMRPFTVTHEWDGISGGNRILARWA